MKLCLVHVYAVRLIKSEVAPSQEGARSPELAVVEQRGSHVAG